MPKIERNVVKPPNEDRWKRNDERENGFLSLAGGASPVKPPNQADGGDWRAGSFPLAGMASPVKPPNEADGGDWRGFSSDHEMPAAVEPGRGAIPVNPFLPGGEAARAVPMRDSAPKGGK